VIDGIEDGEYLFEATVNFFSIERINKGEKDGVIIEEDDYRDNTIQIQININGDRITKITPDSNNMPKNNRLPQ
jgi:hypothetical protein